MADKAPAQHGAVWRLPLDWLRRFRTLLRTGPGKRNLTLVAILNAGAGGSEYAARMVTTFIVQPLVVAALGSFGFGAWQVIQSTVSYAAPLGGKPTHALKWTLATMQESEDFGDKRRQVASGLVIALLLSPVVIVGGAALAWFLPGWLSAPERWVLPLRVAIAIVTADVVVTNLLALPRAVLEGENLAYRRLGITVLIILAGGGLTVAAVALDTGLVGIAAAVLLTSIMSLFTYLRIASREVTWFGLERPSRADVRRFLGLGAWFMAWSLVNQGIRRSDVVVLGLVASAALVTEYTLASYLPTTIGAVVLVGLTGVTPGLGGLMGAGRLDRVRALRHELARLTWMLTLPAAVVVVLLNRSFLALWVGETFYPGTLEVALIVILALQLVYLRNDANIIDLSLDLRIKVLLGVVTVALSVGLGWLLMESLDSGIVGLVLGYLLGRSVTLVGYAKIVSSLVDDRLGSQVRRLVRPVLVGAALLAAAAYTSEFVFIQSWLVLILAGIGAFALAAALLLPLGFDGKARTAVIERLRAARPGR